MQKLVLSRRQLPLLLVATLAASKRQSAWAGKRGDFPSDKYVAQILIEESEPGERLKATIKPFWFEKPVGVRPSPNWPTDNVSFDFAHLAQVPSSSDPFRLTTGALEQLLAINSFERRSNLPRLLFGFRGCQLANGSDRTGWSDGHMVRATRPNHIDLKCLLGVWDLAKGTIALFKGSTVPNVDLMEKHIEGSLRCNMMPTGLHAYAVGPHRGPRQPGAFRQRRPLWVHRSQKELSYSANDPNNIWDDLDGELPFDNIHAAMLSSRPKPPYFSSAGCQVVAGEYDSKHRPTGAWAEFRKAAGLAHPLQFVNQTTGTTKDDGREFDYFLLTGKEAQLVAQGAPELVRALRFGSSGNRVVQLQQELNDKAGGAVEASGVFDRRTLGAVIRWQVAEKLAPTGIVSLLEAQKLGLNWS